MGNEDSNEREHKSTGYVLGIVIAATMGSMFFGFNIGVANLTFSKLQYAYGIDQSSNLSFYTGLFTSAVPLGAGIASLLSSLMLEKLGRRQLMILADIVGIIGTSLFFINNFWIGVIGRFISGLIVGINSALVSIFIKEISPKQISGLTGTFNQGFINTGLIFSYLLGLGIPIETQELIEQDGFMWRFIMTFPIFFCVVRLILFLLVFKFDTPHYYLSKQDKQSAITVINRIYLESHQSKMLEDIQEEIEKKQDNKLTYLSMFKRQYRSRTILGIMLQFFQQTSGINAIVFYSQTIFLSSTNNDKASANVLTIVSGAVLMAFSFLCGLLTKRFGRKTILMGGEVGCILSLSVLGVISIIRDQEETASSSLNFLAIALIFIYEMFFSLSLGPIVWIYNADILPEQGIAISVFSNWFMAFIIGLLTPVLFDKLGGIIFIVFAVFCLVGVLYIKVYMKETKGLSGNQIANLFLDSDEQNSLLNEDDAKYRNMKKTLTDSNHSMEN